ncbi:DUF2203 domain-containing protein [Anaeromyxobacter dehalogenans]|nr:DUF2203 domain-containing protein [Anaeromyxobacter dehalogenans]
MTRFPPMDEGPRYFTVEEANDLVSDLEIEFGRVAQVRADMVACVEALGGAEVAMAVLQRGEPGPAGHGEDAQRLRALADQLGAAVERINGLGCLVKDLEAGLVDFYSLQDGEPVFLCWQFGEPAVSHWHPVDAGFAARQPIEGVTVRPPAFFN